MHTSPYHGHLAVLYLGTLLFPARPPPPPTGRPDLCSQVVSVPICRPGGSQGQWGPGLWGLQLHLRAELGAESPSLSFQAWNKGNPRAPGPR